MNTNEIYRLNILRQQVEKALKRAKKDTMLFERLYGAQYTISYLMGKIKQEDWNEFLGSK